MSREHLIHEAKMHLLGLTEQEVMAVCNEVIDGKINTRINYQGAITGRIDCSSRAPSVAVQTLIKGVIR